MIEATRGISRVCFTGGNDQAKQMFTAVRAETNAQRETTTALPGLGDEAFYRAANVVTEVTNADVEADTEQELKTKCLVALYNEVAAE